MTQNNPITNLESRCEKETQTMELCQNLIFFFESLTQLESMSNIETTNKNMPKCGKILIENWKLMQRGRGRPELDDFGCLSGNLMRGILFITCCPPPISPSLSLSLLCLFLSWKFQRCLFFHFFYGGIIPFTYTLSIA